MTRLTLIWEDCSPLKAGSESYPGFTGSVSSPKVISASGIEYCIEMITYVTSDRPG